MFSTVQKNFKWYNLKLWVPFCVLKWYKYYYWSLFVPIMEFRSVCFAYCSQSLAAIKLLDKRNMSFYFMTHYSVGITPQLIQYTFSYPWYFSNFSSTVSFLWFSFSHYMSFHCWLSSGFCPEVCFRTYIIAVLYISICQHVSLFLNYTFIP